MDPIVLRFVKPFLVAAVMFGAVLYLSGKMLIAFILALVPLLLGWLGILEGLAYGLSGICLLVAVGWGAMPKDARATFHGLTAQVNRQIREQAATTGTNTTSPPKKQDKAGETTGSSQAR